MIIPTFEDIVAFLNYPEEFWEFVTPRIKRIDPTVSGNEIFYVTLRKFDDEGRITNIRVMVPEIIDMRTARINVHELKHAYDLYQLLGQEINNEEEFENSAREKENEFIKIYVRTRLN